MATRRKRSTRSASLRRWLPLLVAASLALALAGCGGSSDAKVSTDGSSSNQEPGADGRPWSKRTWIGAEPTDDPNAIDLVFWGPDPKAEHCDEDRDLHTKETPEGDLLVGIIVHFIEGSKSPVDCPWTKQQIALELDEPIGDRRLIDEFDRHAIHAVDGGFELVAETTPCGRVDCNTPSPDPAPCDGDAIRTAFDTEVDGGIRAEGEPRCDGSFLVTDMDIGSGGCPPTDGAGESPCKKVKRAYFVANEGAWRIVTYGTDETCESLEHTSGIRFPAELCA